MANLQVDSLELVVKSDATSAARSLDLLASKLDVVANKLTLMNNDGLSRLANDVSKLSSSMAGMKGFRSSSINGLVKGLNNLSTVDVNRLSRVTYELRQLTQVTGNFDSIASLGKSINRLGSSAASNGMYNLSQLGRVMQQTMSELSTVSGVSTEASNGINALASMVSQFGYKRVDTAIRNLPLLAVNLKNVFTTMASAPQVSNNTIRFTEALSNLANAGSKVGSATRSLNNGLNRYGENARKARKHTKSLASYIGKLYASYFMVIRAVKGLWNSIKGTADYIEAYNYYNVALGKVASEWKQDYKQYGYENADAYAESFTSRINENLGKMSGLYVNTDTQRLETTSKNLGMNIQELTQYAASIASITNANGIVGEASVNMSKNLVNLAGDISSLFNIDYADASKKLQSGLIGQSRALYSFGIDITNAALQEKALALGINKSVKEMTQGEKMQLRYLKIIEDSKVAWGDLANTIESPSNQLRILKNNLKEVGMVLGQLFVPIFSKALPVLNGFATAIKETLVSFAGIMGITLDLDTFGQGYVEDLDDITDGLEEATEAAEEWKNQLLGFDEVTKLTDSSSSSGASGTLDLTSAIIAASEEYERKWTAAYNSMNTKAKEWAKKFKKYLEPLENIIKSLVNADFKEFGKGIGQAISDVFGGAADFVDKLPWSEIGKAIGNTLAGLAEKAPEIIAGMSKLAKKLGQAALETWVASFTEAPFETLLVTATVILAWTNIGRTMGKAFMTGFKSVANTGASGINLANLGLGGSSGGGLFGGLFSGITSGLATAAAKAGSGVGSVVSSLGSALLKFGKIGLAAAAGYGGGNLLNWLITGEMPQNPIKQISYLLNSSFEEIGEGFVTTMQDAGKGIGNFFKRWGENIANQFKVKTGVTTAELKTILYGDMNTVGTKTRQWLKGIGIEISGDDSEVAKALRKLATESTGEWSTLFEQLANKIELGAELETKTLGQLVGGLQTQFNNFDTSKFETNFGGWFSGFSEKIKQLQNFINGLDFSNVKSELEKTFNYDIEVKYHNPSSSLASSTRVALTNNQFTSNMSNLASVVSSIKFKANGGFVDGGQLFVAREAGPELVGTMGGHTAVANNDQIVEGIEGGVSRAISAMIPYLMQIANNTKDGGQVYLDGEAIFKSTQKHARNYTARTGLGAYPV